MKISLLHQHVFTVGELMLEASQVPAFGRRFRELLLRNLTHDLRHILPLRLGYILELMLNLVNALLVLCWSRLESIA